ncbi:MAG: hypothetical protein AVDCRST_MAG68-836 [uncultured Gemmatimonadetes bacterium]|uniref:Uncharacterized protein n=1 Tax=uncultured Gemmatimonadota bacterium TaxID=203437 RepID=A0A6J4KHL7_9BACT|nr:MAG: hypothetical protein AVDCRST_MAG68-836 [uncultured Gemmatimonadota bacterium]
MADTRCVPPRGTHRAAPDFRRSPPLQEDRYGPTQDGRRHPSDPRARVPCGAVDRSGAQGIRGKASRGREHARIQLRQARAGDAWPQVGRGMVGGGGGRAKRHRGTEMNVSVPLCLCVSV